MRDFLPSADRQTIARLLRSKCLIVNCTLGAARPAHFLPRNPPYPATCSPPQLSRLPNLYKPNYFDIWPFNLPDTCHSSSSKGPIHRTAEGLPRLLYYYH